MYDSYYDDIYEEHIEEQSDHEEWLESDIRERTRDMQETCK